MSDSTKDIERMRIIAERLRFDLDESLLEQCVDTASELGETVNDLDADSSVDTTLSPDVEATGDHYEFLATYDEPRQDQETGPLADLRVVLKDNIAVANLELTCGSDRVAVTPETDAVVTERLLDAGAAVVGKANMDAFGFGPSGEFSDYGSVTNPYATDRIPGGSSSGSGAAVAGGAVDVALGSDTGGSVRIPAACCGIVGAKPTHGLVPRHGFVSFAPSLDTIGPLARDVETAARTLATLAGPDARDPTVSERGLPSFEDEFSLNEDATVGVPEEFFEVSDNEVAAPVREAVAAADVDVVECSLPRGAIEQAYFLVGATEFVWYLDQTGVIRGQGSDYTPAVRALLAAVKDADLGDHIARRLLAAAYLDAETDGESYRAARQEVLAFKRRLTSVLDDVDALVMPTIRTLPPEHGQMETTEDMLALLGNTAPFNLAGNPAISIPVASVQGLPVSAQVVGSRFDDLRTLAISKEIS